MENDQPDNLLKKEIDELKVQHADTKVLYREVAILLFFRHGQTPTTNRLYQLVRRGSMNTVATVLNEFWSTLRENTRVRIDHPGVPDELKNQVGELIESVWEKANVAARGELSAMMAESRDAIARAELAVSEKSDAVSSLNLRLVEAQAALNNAETTTAKFTKLLELEQREHAATAARHDAAVAESIRLQTALDAARHDFALELDKMRATTSQSEERLAAVERLAHLEVERERQLRKDSENQIAVLRQTLSEQTISSTKKVELLVGEMGELRGRYQSAESRNATLEAELARLANSNALLSESLAATTVRLETAEKQHQNPVAKPPKRRISTSKASRRT